MENRTLVMRLARGRVVAPVTREQVLLFRVGEETYGIALRGLWEVLPPEGVTDLPTPPHQMCTALAYRGQRLPLIRLSELFGVSANRVPATARVLLTQARGKPIGLLVDEVAGVIEVEPRHIARVPALATLMNPEFFSGIFSRGSRAVLLISADGLGNMGEVAGFYDG